MTLTTPAPRGALLAAALLSLAPLAAAQEAPRGVFCSCPPTGPNSDSVLASVAQQPFVDGVLVRVGWDLIEPAPGVYDFSLVQGQLDLAEQYDVGVALAIVQGPHAPAWLEPQGVQMVDFDFMGQPQRIPAAWDATYQATWANTVAALGSAFDGHARIDVVHVTNSSFNGFEMQLPLTGEPTFVAAGYTDAAYTASWVHSIDAFANAFPSHAIDVEVHPVFGRPDVAIDTVTYGFGAYGTRFGAFGAWWSARNAADVYPTMDRIVSAFAGRSFAAVQVVGSWVTTPERFDDDLAVYASAYGEALERGVGYVEVWNADLLEPSLEPLMRRLHRELR